jgi:DNA-binding transcriptional MerR regulator
MRTALTLQRDHDFKLARIREYLDAHDGDTEVALPASILETPRRYRRDELLASANASAGLLDDAVSAG